ncbi:thioredoxin family protein [Fusibacter tunisiensis]|uniref:Thiol-disulfide isomerase/thioredoxin n=1 Tax=Fusibacter tunisiensis TaxID=1008308 RepID=A0ABS2MRU1_9FIRM|nr:thioredoxin family protein [Fusibacter tunisiensis]MBM7562113.1 thiol-disulfide isomerase/thioredoxin [Fusibacter tunisiensis]
MEHLNDLIKVTESIENDDLVVMLFSDLGCNVCLSIYPDLEDMSKRYPKAHFMTADVEVMKELVGKHLIFVYPTLVVFAQGRETKRFERVFSLDDLESTVNRYYQMIF